MGQRHAAVFLVCIFFASGWALLGSERSHPLDEVYEDALDDESLRAQDLVVLRRMSLQLRGVVPSVEEIRRFEEAPQGSRLASFAVRFLKDADFGHYWGTRLGSALRETSNQRGTPYGSYFAYLARSFHENKPYDTMVKEMLLATGDPGSNPAANFYVRDDGDPLQIAEYVGRVFYGSRLSCARCHDHPFDPDFTRRDYYGMAAFFSQVWIRRNLDTDFMPRDRIEHFPTEAREEYEERRSRWHRDVWNRMNQAQRARYREQHKLEFYQVVYEKDLGLRFPYSDNAPGGDLVDPVFPDGTPAAIPEGEDRRRTFARWLTRNERFRKVMINRIWYELMGWAFFYPLDDWNNRTELREPELLNHLDEVWQKQDLRPKDLIYYIVLSESYRRRAPRPTEDADDLRHFPAHRMNADQLMNTMLRVSGEGRINHIWERANLAPGDDPAQPGIDFTGSGELLAPIKNQRNFENACQVPRPAHDRTLLAVFGAGERRDVDDDSNAATIEQVLTLLNGNSTHQIVRSATAENSWLRRDYQSHKDMRKTVESVYLSMLGRKPTSEESQLLEQMISSRYARQNQDFNATLVQDLIWSIANSQEFIHVY